MIAIPDDNRHRTTVSPYVGELIADKDAIRRIVALAHRSRRFELTETGGMIWRLRAALVSPLRAAKEAQEAVRRFGEPTFEHHDIPLARQYAWLWWLNLRYLYDANSVYLFRLFSWERAAPRPLFLPQHTAMLMYRSIMSLHSRRQASILADKRLFASWCEERGIASAEIIMEFESGRILRSNLNEQLEPECDLFAKWAFGYGGAGTQRWTRSGEHWLDPEQRAWDFNDIVESLVERSKDGMVVLQPCLANHPALHDLSPNALSTIRIMTTRRPREGPRFLAGVLRMETGKSSADNFAQGGIASAVDYETGVLDVAISNDKQNCTYEHEVHPDTGARITGRQVPFWREAINMAVDAHSRLGDIPCVGWDVAVLQSGPALVEGNWAPCIKFLQVTTRTPVLMTEFAGAYGAWLNEPGYAFDDRWLFERRQWSSFEESNGDE